MSPGTPFKLRPKPSDLICENVGEVPVPGPCILTGFPWGTPDVCFRRFCLCPCLLRGSPWLCPRAAHYVPCLAQLVSPVTSTLPMCCVPMPSCLRVRLGTARFILLGTALLFLPSGKQPKPARASPTSQQLPGHRTLPVPHIPLHSPVTELRHHEITPTARTP